MGQLGCVKSRGVSAKVLKKFQKLAEGGKVFWKIKIFYNLGTSPRFFGVLRAQKSALKGRLLRKAAVTQGPPRLKFGPKFLKIKFWGVLAP